MELNELRKLKVQLSAQPSTEKQSKKEELAALPWEDCIKKVSEEYGGDKEIAAKVCGMIKAENQSKVVDPAEKEFTIPKPSGEPEAEYISKCMKAIGSEYDSQEQALAVCYAQLK